ncbi:hypothetical protein AGMMS49546_22620 [Spirochaetia bacterium]|nr:hypothetical protein AGMMS49546_22620 [Spirochaetia bacterium]
MKKTTLLAVLLISAFVFLPAEETPHRKRWEIGSDLGMGFANNMVGIGDILKKNILVDLDAIGPSLGDRGAMMDLNLFGDAFFNLTVKQKYFLTFFTGFDGGINGITSKSFIELVSQGNRNNHSSSGDMANISGAVFGEAGAGFKTAVKKFKLGGSAAYYVPLFYIPQGNLKYTLDAETGLRVGVSSDINIYTPLSFKNSDKTSTSLGKPAFNTGDILSSGGVDISLSAEYAFFPFLDAGVNLSHIPLVPATLKSQIYVSIDEFEIKGDNLLSNPNIDMPKVEPKFDYKDDVSFRVLRPMRGDFYADYRPLKTNLLLIRPNVGFTVFNPNGKPYFNAGALVKLSLPKDIFSVYAGMAYDEAVWKNRLGLGLNFRVCEFLMEASVRSQDFLKSFDGHGFGLTLGTRFGF